MRFFLQRRRKDAGGFTFVEVLAALLFLAAVVPVIVTALTLSNKAGELTERGEAAGQLAENKLNELLVGDAWQTGAATSGDFGADWPGYRWELTQSTWTGGGTGGTTTGTASSSSTGSGSGAITGSSGGTTGTGVGAGSVNTTMTELKLEVFFKIQGNERSVTLSTLVNTLTSSTTTTGTGTTGVGK